MGEDVTPPGPLDFRVIRDHLDTALEALTNLIDRDWPERLATIPGARAFFLTTMKVATTTYDTVRYLVRDYPRDSTPRPEHAISIPPLSRSLLDQLFTVVFLGEDLPARTAWYYKAGWREGKEVHARYTERFGNRSRVEWLEYGRFLDSIRVEWGISDEEAAQPKLIDYWPIPSQMLRRQDLQPDTRAFLEYLVAWSYKALSQEAHLSFPGLARRGAPLLLPRGQEERTRELAKRKSEGMLTTITLILALATEAEHLLHYGTVRDRLAFVWRVLIEHWGEARDFFEMRYARILEGGPTHGATR